MTSTNTTVMHSKPTPIYSDGMVVVTSMMMTSVVTGSVVSDSNMTSSAVTADTRGPSVVVLAPSDGIIVPHGSRGSITNEIST